MPDATRSMGGHANVPFVDRRCGRKFCSGQKGCGTYDGNDSANVVFRSGCGSDRSRCIVRYGQGGRSVDGSVGFSLLGYLLYASLYAAVGAAVDSPNDAGQFVMPLTIPLLLGFYCAITIINNPNGPVAFWMSMIPLTSPVVMMVRVPFGVPAWEIVLSALLLLVTFLALTWVAAKIYRIGLLSYGTKPSYKDLWKWIKQS